MKLTQKTGLVLCLLGLSIAPLSISITEATAAKASHAMPAGTAQKATDLDHDSYLGIPTVPHKVVINRQNTRAFAQSSLKIVEAYGGKVIVLPLPKQASNVQLHLPDGNATLLAWQTEKAMPYKPQGFIEKQRITYESMANSLGGALTALQAQYDTMVNSISALPPSQAAEELKKNMPSLALLGTRLHSTQRDLDVANARAALFKDAIPLSQQLVISLDTKLAIGHAVRVSYSYTLSDSFWKPVYVIDANTSNNTIHFKLLANIQQNSDLDWDNTIVELSTAQGNEQNLPAVQPWVVSKAENVQARTYNMPMQNKMLMAKADVESSGMGGFQGENALAVWTLKKKVAIPEGQTSLILQENVLQAPLERIARPSSYAGGKVWLSAAPNMVSTFLPVGEAQYLLDGIPVGQDTFAVKEDKMPFFFGVDPLVTVNIKKDIRKSDEAGIINKDQVYTWGWTYTVENKRQQAVKVRLEEPQTQLADKAMSVTYSDTPAPTKGENHTFVWTLDVPAQDKTVIQRNITVKAPKGMTIHPGR